MIETLKLSRTNDPVTSKIAAEKMVKTEKVKRQREMCLDAVRQQPGRTAAEYAKILGIERHIPSRRLPDLRDKFVVNGFKRVCNETKNPSLTWWPAGMIIDEMAFFDREVGNEKTL